MDDFTQHPQKFFSRIREDSRMISKTMDQPHTFQKSTISVIWRGMILSIFVVTAYSGCAVSKNIKTQPAQKPPSPSIWQEFLSKLQPTKKPAPPVASAVQWAGEIRMVNEADHFVLIESTSGTPVIPGEKYHAVLKGRETAVLQMTALKNPPFLIADILRGNPTVGDKIYLPQKEDKQQAMAPSPR